MSNVLPGNTINLTYTDTATNTQHQVTIVNVTDPTALPLQNAPDANPKQIGDQFLRRHGLDRFAIEYGARQQQSAVLESVRFNPAT